MDIISVTEIMFSLILVLASLYVIGALRIKYIKNIFYIPLITGSIFFFLVALDLFTSDIHAIFLHSMFTLFILMLARNIKRLGL